MGNASKKQKALEQVDCFLDAARDGRLDIVDKLLQTKDSHVNEKQGMLEWTPLHYASREGHLEIAEKLLDHGGMINWTTGWMNWTALDLATVNGHGELVRRLIERGADLNAQNYDGNTALHLAIQAKHMDIAKILIDHGCNLNIQNNLGESPLHVAVRKGWDQVAILMVEQGAEVNGQDNDGRTPIYHCIYKKNVEIMKLLIQQGAKWYTAKEPLLHYFARNGVLEMVRLMSEVGMSVNGGVNICDEAGRTAIHAAVTLRSERCVQCLQILVNSGADLNVKSNDGLTAYEYALKQGFPEPLRYFKDENPGHVSWKVGGILNYFPARNQDEE